MVHVYAVETPEGWVLQTADDARDLLAGPEKTESDILKIAKDCDFNIVTTQILSFSTSLIVKDRHAGDLFRIGPHWYRMLKRDGKGIVVHILGTDKETVIPDDTKITEVSVTSKQ